MNVWLTRLRARCSCGYSFEAFALPPEEVSGRAIARTRSGFAALLVEDRELMALFQRILSEAKQPELPPPELAQVAAFLADPAPDDQPYDIRLGPVCPRCESDVVTVKLDKQVPEVVLALPLLSYERWFRLPPSERRAAVLAAAAQLAPAGVPQSPVRG